jgi:hypothetical protein
LGFLDVALLLCLASAVILRPEFHRIHYHILLYQNLKLPPSWSDRSPYLYPPVTGRHSFTQLRLSTVVFSVFYTGAATFSSKKLLNCTHKAEWTLFLTHYFSENLIAPETEPGHLDL